MLTIDGAHDRTLCDAAAAITVIRNKTLTVIRFTRSLYARGGIRRNDHRRVSDRMLSNGFDGVQSNGNAAAQRQHVMLSISRSSCIVHI